MRAYVFNDRALGRHAGRFVWLSIDTEKERNAAFVARFPIQSWPTLFCVEPVTERAVLRWPGSVTVGQLEQLLDDGERAAGAAAATPGARLLAAAARLAGEGKPEEAAAQYRASLAREVALDEGTRAHAAEGLVMQLQAAHDHAACAREAASEAPSLRRGPGFANVVAMGLYCAESAPPVSPWRRAAMASLVPLALEAVEVPGLLADDRSALYEELVTAREQADEAAEARRLTTRWVAFLDEAAASAANPEARAALDPLRVNAALKLGEPARAIPFLEQSEREIPDDYNAPARLAILYQTLGRLDDALAAIDRALAKVYGPRRVRLLQTRANILARLSRPPP